MKKILIVLLSLVSCLMFGGCGSKLENNEVMRIHIRANSNSEEDQGIKLKVRDNIIEYITPLISECKNYNDVKSTLASNLNEIKCVADKVLRQNGFEYQSNPKITQEYFPTRNYDGQIFEAGNYNALIINLGSGAGNNWWCVAYPPLCFVGSDNGTDGIEYRSKLVELINNFLGK